MKNKWLIFLGIIIIVLVSLIIIFDDSKDDKKYLSEINYNQLTNLINKQENFILYIKQTGCSHCQSFTPKFQNVLNKYKIKAYYINLTNLETNERTSFNNMFEVEGTPMVLFFKNGEKIPTTIDGDKSKSIIVNKLKLVGYIKTEEK